MILKSVKLQELQDFCNNQFKQAEGENAKLLTADEVKRLTETRNIANECINEYNELATNYQQLLKDYNELILHPGTTADKTKEVENPAGDVKAPQFDMKKFKDDFLKNYKGD